jgi:predicted ABC-type ATPase
VAEWWIIGGPNGAGKSTFFRMLKERPEYNIGLPLDNYLNADVIAAGMTDGDPRTKDISAGRAFMRARQECFEKGVSFVQESTLASVSDVKQILKMREAGWRCGLIFLWLKSASDSKMRVAKRVNEEHGHHITDEEIDRRYPRVMNNLREYVGAMDRAVIFDNSDRAFARVAEFVRDRDGRPEKIVYRDGHDILRILP